VRLNKFENHRTESLYEDSLVAKLFVFQFFNSYSYLTYVAFIKGLMVTDCADHNCFHELTHLLIIQMTAPLMLYCIEEGIIQKVSTFCFSPHFCICCCAKIRYILSLLVG
jgi:hypothetical protein